MALNIHPANRPFVINQVVALIYGQPGIGKTSLGFSAKKPILLDFDRGAHRSGFRGDTVIIEKWRDVSLISADDLAGYETVVVDTVGRTLDTISAALVQDNPKNARSDGSLSLQGFGALKNAFSSWIKRLQGFGLDIVLLAHDKEEKTDGDSVLFRPDAQGGSYLEIFKVADSVAYYHAEKNNRVLEFSPAEKWVGKDPAGFGAVIVPDFTDAKGYMASLLQRLKETLSDGAQESDSTAEIVSGYAQDIDPTDDVDELLDIWRVSERESMPVRKQIWALILRRAKVLGYIWDKTANDFVEE